MSVSHWSGGVLSRRSGASDCDLPARVRCPSSRLRRVIVVNWFGLIWRRKLGFGLKGVVL